MCYSLRVNRGSREDNNLWGSLLLQLGILHLTYIYYMKLLFAPIILCVLFSSCAEVEIVNHDSIDDLTWVDLTHTFDSTTLYWPNNADGFMHRTDAEGVNSQGFYYSSYSICTPEHGGTHMDAPIHFAEGKQTADKIPLTSLT